MATHNLDAEAFPELDEAQMAGLAKCPLTSFHQFKDREKLFETGDRDLNFFVVKSGQVEIVDESGDVPKTIKVLGRGQFTGDVSQLTGGPSLVSGIALGTCESFEVSPDALRHLLNNHPELSDVILQAFLARRHFLRESASVTGLRVLGAQSSRETFRVREFLAKNGEPFTWLDLDHDPQVKQLLKQFGVAEAETPVVIFGRKLLLRNPSNRQLADALGLRRSLDQSVYDLTVVGAGPAGLAAGVYGASEGLRTLVLERTAPGGQAGRSMRIENYLGFHKGITGAALAERATLQAIKFGACLPVATQAISLSFDNKHQVLHLDDGQTVTTKCLLIATGADYRMLGVDGCEQFEGCGVYYAATPLEAQMCLGSEVVVVGGGYSAGQAAVFLASHVRKVYLVVRGDELGKNMSDYLVKRIEACPNIEVLLNTVVRKMHGDKFLSEVELVNNKTGEVRTLKVPALFSFIGAVPRTEWLPDEIEKDAKDFVRTGAALAQSPHWAFQRQPYLLETSRPGVFAAGDVRSGSVKRVASAVGEGAMAVQFVHEYLKEV